MDKYDHLFKLVIIGDSSAGKSCLLHRYTDGKFVGEKGHTVGVEFASKIVSVGDRRCKLQCWDTAGQEKYRAVTKSYYRGASAAIVVYDITRSESFANVSRWIQDTRSLANNDVVIVLCGNKVDLKGERQVSFLEASRYAQENDLLFLECSAKTGEMVHEIFAKLCHRLIQKLDEDAAAVVDDSDGFGHQMGSSSLESISLHENSTGSSSGIFSCSRDSCRC